MHDLQLPVSNIAFAFEPNGVLHFEEFAQWALAELELKDLKKFITMLNKETRDKFGVETSPWLGPQIKAVARTYQVARAEALDIADEIRKHPEENGLIDGLNLSFMQSVGLSSTAAAHRELIPTRVLTDLGNETQSFIETLATGVQPTPGQVSWAKHMAWVWLQFILIQRGCTMGGSNAYISHRSGLSHDLTFTSTGMQVTIRYIKHWTPRIHHTVARGTSAQCRRTLPVVLPVIPYGPRTGMRYWAIRIIQWAQQTNQFTELDSAGYEQAAQLMTHAMIALDIPRRSKIALQATDSLLDEQIAKMTFTSHSLRYTAATISVQASNELLTVHYVGWNEPTQLQQYFFPNYISTTRIREFFSFVNTLFNLQLPPASAPAPTKTRRSTRNK